ncbi:cupin domain-containing protein [Streptacidiphilus sp. PAMC 29251]
MSPTRNVPQVLLGLDECLAQAAAEQGGALWRLAEAGRQLDANLVRLPPGAEVAEHVEEDLDVLLVVVEGGGRLSGGAVARGGIDDDGEVLAPRSVAWLPRASRRALRAGPEGLVYLTVHQRRPALSIKGLHLPDDGESGGGEGPCRLNRVCAGCGRLSPEASARYCGQCGEPLPTS